MRTKLLFGALHVMSLALWVSTSGCLFVQRGERCQGAGCDTADACQGDDCHTAEDTCQGDDCHTAEDNCQGDDCHTAEDTCVCTEQWDPVCGSDGETYSNTCFASCAGARVDHEGECDGGCACDDVYAPVCGSDGRTYANACEASCARVAVDHEGECAEDGCLCTQQYDPVCGSDGQTYGNGCLASCAGVMVDRPGACQACDAGSCDGGQSDGACKTNADCGNGLVCHPGKQTCQPRCEIQCFRYDPVCGEDGSTYACGQPDAWCHGIRVAHEGECQETDTGDDGVPPDCICTREYAPVCGEDGQTYGNRCTAGCAGVKIVHAGECS